jgi:hypothetical protein
LIIKWTKNTDIGRKNNGIKCKTHTNNSRTENGIRCRRHINPGRIKNGIKWKKHIDKVGQRTKSNVEETTLIIEGCIKKSIEEHELEGISYSSRFKEM